MELSLGANQQRESGSSVRGQHKRIFGGVVKQDGAARSAVEQPQCLFHKDNRITKFCQSRECTLPLCDICQPIHLAEHEKQNTQPHLDCYLSSREKAQQELQLFIRRCRQVHTVVKQGRDSIMGVLLAQKNQIEQTVNTFFEEFVARIEAATLTEDRLFELERRQEKITKGSVKAVIQHYAETYPTVRFPKISISFSAATLTNILQNFTSILPEGETTNSRPASSHELRQPLQHVRSQQNIQPAGDAHSQFTEINKQLIYSPKPAAQPVGIRPFAHIEQKALSPHTVQQLTTPVHSHHNLEQRAYEPPKQQHVSPIEKHQLDMVSPIQKLSMENSQPKPAERNIHYDIVERKENVDHNRNQGYMYLHSQAQPIVSKNTASIHINTKLVTQEVNSIHSSIQDQPQGSFRPHSSKSNSQSLESKDWRSVIETVQLNKNSSRGNLQGVSGSVKTLQDEKKLTDKILSPEEIKAMLGRRAPQRQQSQQQTRNYSVHRVEAVRHGEVTYQQQQNIQPMLGRDMDLKHSYFDHQSTIGQGHPPEQRVSSFSPEFNQNRQAQQRMQTEPELRVFKPIEPLPAEQGIGTYANLYDRAEYENRPTQPYQFRYVPQSQPKTGRSDALNINDLRPGTPKLEIPRY